MKRVLPVEGHGPEGRTLEVPGWQHLSEVLNRASAALVQTLDVDEVLQTLLECLAQLVNYDSAQVMLREGETLLRTYARRAGDSFVPPGLYTGAELDAGVNQILAEMLERTSSVLIPDTRQDPRWQVVPGTEYVRSWIGVPLVIEKRVIGIYGVDKSQPGFFTPKHVRLVELLAPPASVATYHACLLKSAKQHAAELENRLAEQSRVEAEWRRSEAHFAAIFRASPDPITISRLADGKILEVNPAFERLSEYTREEIIGRKASEIRAWVDPQDRKRLLAALRAEGRVIGMESRFRAKSGKTRVGLVSAEIIELSEEPCLLIVGKDITELKRTVESLRHLSHRLLNLQDEERRRITRELHDSTSQSLAALVMNLTALKRSVGKLGRKSRTILGESLGLARSASREIRTLSFLLHPPVLDELGLIPALRWYVEGLKRRGGIRIQLEVPSELPRFAPDLETTLFRIVQESLKNVHRHSGSATARVSLQVLEGEIRLRVTDKGRGMLSHVLRQASGESEQLGVGILGMQERVRQFGGKLAIDSNSHGTAVSATVPLLGVSS